MVVVMPTMGAFAWMFGRSKNRVTSQEYQSPNSWSKWLTVNNEAQALQDELVNTFNNEQMRLYRKYRDKILEAEREKPWQGEYAQYNQLQNISK